MTINIRTKGQEGEREIQRMLEPIVRRLLSDGGYPIPEKAIIQRNQNQSAVGGSDLSNTFGLAIEVKRQEALSINTWWEQCLKAAQAANEEPVLLYRQNGKKWKAIAFMWLTLPGGNSATRVRAEMSVEDFLLFFEKWVKIQLINGNGIKL